MLFVKHTESCHADSCHWGTVDLESIIHTIFVKYKVLLVPVSASSSLGFCKSVYNNMFVCVVTLISDMKGKALLNAGMQVQQIPELEGDEQELSGYIQDNFEFLDLIDCSVSNQVCVCVCTAATL